MVKKRIFQLSVLLILLVLIVYTRQREWSYEESTGPEYWGELAVSNRACAKGSEQSPIIHQVPPILEKEILRIARY